MVGMAGRQSTSIPAARPTGRNSTKPGSTTVSSNPPRAGPTTDTGSASPQTAPGYSSWPVTNPFSRQDGVPWHAILSRKRSESACEEATERGEDSIQVGDADRLVGLMGLGGLSRPEVDGGDADLREA